MKDLVDTTEMYLRTVYELNEEGIIPLRARIAERLDQSGPTVSQTVSRMERDGLIQVLDDRTLKLTEKGEQIAIGVMRKHRIAESLLIDIIKLPADQVHEEACRWEHVMSDEVERRAYEVLGRPTHSPFGTPIPGLDILGVPQEDQPEPLGTRVTDLPIGKTVTGRISLINEVLQSDNDNMTQLREQGIKLDAEVTVKNENATVQVQTEEGTVELPRQLAYAMRIERTDK